VSASDFTPPAGPAITVVVATFNAGPILTRCVDSVLSQSHAPVGLVVIDGGSTDGTIERIRGYGDRISHWESAPDDGVYDAWNKALHHVPGEWVCFLGADDRLATRDALSRMAPYLRDASERVVYGITHVKDDRDVLKNTMGMPWSETRPALNSRMSLPNPSTFYHRELFERHGPFDTSFKIAGDYELLLRELRDHDAVFVDTVVTIMGAGGLSQDPRNWPRSLREAARARRKNHIPVTPDWRSFAIYEACAYALMFRLFGPGFSSKLWVGYRRAFQGLGALIAKARQ
jgi:glycosyltransferase involved in cell wall biosynthesis